MPNPVHQILSPIIAPPPVWGGKRKEERGMSSRRPPSAAPTALLEEVPPAAAAAAAVVPVARRVVCVAAPTSSCGVFRAALIGARKRRSRKAEKRKPRKPRTDAQWATECLRRHGDPGCESRCEAEHPGLLASFSRAKCKTSCKVQRAREWFKCGFYVMFADPKVRTGLQKLVGELQAKLASPPLDGMSPSDQVMMIIREVVAFARKHQDALAAQIDAGRSRLFGAEFAGKCDVNRFHKHDTRADGNPTSPRRRAVAKADKELHDEAKRSSSQCEEAAQHHYDEVKKRHTQLQKQVDKMDETRGTIFQARQLGAFVNRLPSFVRNSGLGTKLVAAAAAIAVPLLHLLNATTGEAGANASVGRYAGGMVAASESKTSLIELIKSISAWSGEAAATAGIWNVKGMLTGFGKAVLPEWIRANLQAIVALVTLVIVVWNYNHGAKENRLDRKVRGEHTRAGLAKHTFRKDNPGLFGLSAYLVECVSVMNGLVVELKRAQTHLERLMKERHILVEQLEFADRRTGVLNKLIGKWNVPREESWEKKVKRHRREIEQLDDEIPQVKTKITAIETDLQYVEMTAKSAVDEKESLLVEEKARTSETSKDTESYQKELDGMMEEDRKRLKTITSVASTGVEISKKIVVTLLGWQAKVVTVAGKTALNAYTGGVAGVVAGVTK
jgi:hypothetical protein